MIYNEEYAKQGLSPMCREPLRYGRMMKMNEQQKKTAESGAETIQKPCVFGAEIKNPCPIRTILEATPKEKGVEEGEEVLEKALGTQIPPQVQVLLSPLQGFIEALSQDKDIRTLSKFCRCCPFLAKYTLESMP